MNKTDKAITDLTLKFSGNFDASTTYKITLGTTSIEVTGAQIEAGEVGEGLSLEPGKVTPLRLELAHPSYYANPIGLRSVSATLHVYGENAATQPPVIATDPASVSVKAGESATFTVVASGRPAATIQWYRVPKGCDRRDGDSGRHERHVHPDDDARGRRRTVLRRRHKRQRIDNLSARDPDRHQGQRQPGPQQDGLHVLHRLGRHRLARR